MLHHIIEESFGCHAIVVHCDRVRTGELTGQLHFGSNCTRDAALIFAECKTLIAADRLSML